MDLSAATIHAALALVADEGWEGPAARELLDLLRQRIVEPTVRRSGLRGPAADQACASAWAAAWDALRRPSARSADNPAGMAWVAVRRAVAQESSWSRGSTGRIAVDLMRDDEWVRLTRITAGAIPAPDDAGPSWAALEPIMRALSEAGWAPALLADLVGQLAEGTRHQGLHQGWRTAAEQVDCPAWRASRLWTLLVGAPGSPGLVELVGLHGTDLLADPDIEVAIRSTVRRWLPAPASSLRAATHRRAVPIALSGSPCPQAIWSISESTHTVRAPRSGGRDRSRLGKLSTINGGGGRMPTHAYDHSQSRHGEDACPALPDRP